MNIAKAEPVDAGKYTCTLENKHGKASSSGEIQVRKLYQAPHFLQKFTDQQQVSTKNKQIHKLKKVKFSLGAISTLIVPVSNESLKVTNFARG